METGNQPIKQIGFRLENSKLCFMQLTISRYKEIAREMNIEPTTVRARLDNARFKLGMQKTLRGLCMEAFKRGIIVPLSLTLAIALSAIPNVDYFRGNTDTSSTKTVLRYSKKPRFKLKDSK